MLTNADNMSNTIVYQAQRFHVGFGRVRSPVGVASLAVVVLLSLLFAAAIIGALHPAPLVDPMLAVVQGGL